MRSIKRTRTVSVTTTCYNQTQSSSADAIADNDDVLTEILLRLPIRSLLRFKSVSKHWLSLISSPTFSLLLNPNPNPISGLFLHRSSFLINPQFDFVPLNTNPPYTPPFKTLTFVNDPSGIQILQSCNGLFCCSSFRANQLKRNYYIYNPTTKQFTVLPQFRNRKFRTVFSVNLAFDPSKSPHYKVICIRCSDLSHDHYQIEIYSSETRLWKVSGEPFTANVDINFKNGVYWNGAIHWISPSEDSLYFDVHQERIHTMPMPPVPDGWDERRVRYFGGFRDHLHLIEIYGPRTTQFNVYEMERDYSKWFVKFCVDLDEVPTAFPEMIRSYLHPLDLHYYAFSILCLVRGENDEGAFLVLHIPGKAIGYNLKDKTFKKLCDFAPGRDDVEGIDIVASLRFGWFDAHQYIESLSCV